MKRSIRIVTAALLLVGAASLAQAQDGPPPDPTADPLMISAGFLSAHPDLRYRLLGLERYREQRFEDAFRFFQRSAFYADKPSQGMVAEMLWKGEGVAQDRALAYAWMDLAAERGYLGFLGLRERYWNALDEAERARALEQGQAVYAKYGDAAAQPRLATVLRRERKNITGSRTGFVGSLQIFVPGPGGYQPIDGSKLHDDRFWDPEKYMAWHDAIWARPMIGRVDVGEVEKVDEPEPLPSRIPKAAPETDAQEPTTPDADESGLGTQPPQPGQAASGP
ncbi:hypothetical protein FKV24_014845 [Lysobacter maris]|uniref:Uncharacterized protein n=1 Tax=Marilutibacter maris TaxID=1605891 RepID=A0A508ABX9_9GAMM|nr:hypothetical protein [Lysobacter maris]KAB8172439.1 hypothetical protein FKV24_014845 [Lysobacter maris]